MENVMKLFTSRYGYAGLAQTSLPKVGISLGAPRMHMEYELAEIYRALAPTRAQFKLNKPEEFIPAYWATLQERGGVRAFRPHLEAISARYGGKSLVLLCYEDCRILPNGRLNQWCHRLVFAQFWKEGTGEAVLELEHVGKEVNVFHKLGVSWEGPAQGTLGI